nr:MAG TPA: hypothetical protein [Caudoviricetes sp.]
MLKFSTIRIKFINILLFSHKTFSIHKSITMIYTNNCMTLNSIIRLSITCKPEVLIYSS